MKAMSFLLTSSAVVALAMGGGGFNHQAVAQTEAPAGAEAGSADLLEPAQTDGGDVAPAQDAPAATDAAAAEEPSAPADPPVDASSEPVVPAAEETAAEPAAPEATTAQPQEDPVAAEPAVEPQQPAGSQELSETAAPAVEPTEAAPVVAEPGDEAQPAEGEPPSPEAAAPTSAPEAELPAAQSEVVAPDARPDAAAPAAGRKVEAESPPEPAQTEELSPQDLRDAQRASAEQAVLAAEEEETNKSEKQRDSDRADRMRIFGTAAAGAAIGALIPELGGRLVRQQGDRVIIQQGDDFVVRKDETERLMTDGSTVSVEELAEGRMQATVTRPNGTQIITLRDAGGNLLRRVRRLPNGDEVLLFDETQTTRVEAEDLATLPPIPLDERRVVYLTRASEQEIEEALLQAPIAPAARAYSLREVRDTDRLRWQMPSILLDALTFETNSAELGDDQLDALDEMGATLAAVIERMPDEVFLIEGHTDAVGGDLHNLALSDRRAETVATLLTQYYGVPPENVIAQGYGEQDLTVPTLGPSRENRRVEVRRITPLLRQ